MLSAESTPGQDGGIRAFPLALVGKLYDRGLYLQAYSEGNAVAPFPHWPGTDGQVIAAKLAYQLGSTWLGNKLIVRAYRADERSALAGFYYGFRVLHSRGPLACWDFLETIKAGAEVRPPVRADLLALQARCAAYLRDFEIAEQLLGEAEKTSPGLPWLHSERAMLLELQDRYEEALAEVEKALVEVPFYRPASEAKAHLLLLLNREPEALEFLHEASRSIESGALYARLFMLQSELGLYNVALQTMEQYVKHTPLMDKVTRQWLDQHRCDALYFSGRLGPARRIAENLSHNDLYAPFAERLRKLDLEGEKPRRKVLPIDFVRQHHMTCGPATLTTICRFWGKAAEHLAVAEKICYDGTPAQSERSWAEQNGFIAREFRVTTEAAEALIDRGVPFTLTTSEATSAHLQAVIGYDRTRESLFIRDPYMRHTVEFHAERSLKRYAASGPRGMAMVPKEKPELLEGINLPEVGLYDQLYELNLALERHDRARAQQVYENLRALAPDHRLTWQARRTLGQYDGNNIEVLAAVSALLELYPDDGHLRLARVSLWRELGHREERLEWLREACSKKETDPALLHEYVYDLMGDARQEAEAIGLLNRARRLRPGDSVNLHLTAGIHWSRGERERAMLLYRFALCLDDKREQYARSYFIGCRWLGQTGKALSFLTERFKRFGKKSSAPGMTLAEAHEQLDQYGSAFTTVEAALAQRPEDGALMLFAAEMYGRYALMDRAKELLQLSRNKARELSWLRTSALLADWSQNPEQALSYWRRILERDPLSMEANRACANLMDITSGRAKVLQFLRQTCDRFPRSSNLTQLLYEYSGNEPADTQLAILDRLTKLNPRDPWGWREIALLRLRHNQLDAAEEAAEQAFAIDPNSTATHGVLGWVHREKGDSSCARESFLKALSLQLDNQDAMEALVNCSETIGGKREALAWIEKALAQNSTFGDAVLGFASVASGILADCELEEALRRLHQLRPELWQSWSALGAVLARSGKFAEALEITRTGANRFPLIPRLWLDLARVHRARLQHEEEITALGQALQINSRWPLLWQDLGLAQERAGRWQESIEALQKALIHEPRDAHTHCLLADFRIRYGPIEQAPPLLMKALELAPGHRWGWQLLRLCSVKLSKPNLAVDLARALTEKRAGDVSAWLALAEMLTESGQGEEGVAAIEKAILLSPRHVEARECKCIALANVRRFDEAAEATAPPDWVGPLPPVLRARGAWINAARGNLRSAVEQMRAVLRDEPTLVFGWSELCSWLVSLQDFEGALIPAETLLRLSPLVPYSHGYAGLVKLRLGRRDEARQHLRHAIQLDPSYTFARLSLADLEIEDGKYAAALQVLDASGENTASAEVLLRKCRIELLAGMFPSAEKTFRELANHPEGTTAAWFGAFEAFHAAAARRLGTLLDELKNERQLRAPIASMWVMNRTRQNKWFFPRQLEAFLHRNREDGEQGMATYIEALARMIAATQARPFRFLSRKRFYLRWILSRHGKWLHAHHYGWGIVGYALSICGEHKKTCEWLKDYSERKTVETWMVHNYVDVCHVLGREEEALRAAEFGAALPGFGDQVNSLLLWCALEDVLDDFKTVRSIERLDEASFTMREKVMKAVLDSMSEILRGTEQGAAVPRKFTRSDRKILREFIAAHPSNKWASRYSRRALAAVRKKTGQWFATRVPLSF